MNYASTLVNQIGTEHDIIMLLFMTAHAWLKKKQYFNTILTLQEITCIFPAIMNSSYKNVPYNKWFVQLRHYADNGRISLWFIYYILFLRETYE